MANEFDINKLKSFQSFKNSPAKDSLKRYFTSTPSNVPYDDQFTAVINKRDAKKLSVYLYLAALFSPVRSKILTFIVNNITPYCPTDMDINMETICCDVNAILKEIGSADHELYFKIQNGENSAVVDAINKEFLLGVVAQSSIEISKSNTSSL